MWQAPREEDKKRILEICKHFVPMFSDISYEKLYARIFNGYCWGESGLPIISIEDWEEVFNYTKFGASVLACFESWEDYDKCEEDWHKKK